VTAPTLAEVAEVARQAYTAGRGLGRAVAERYGCSDSHGRTLIRLARAAGHSIPHNTNTPEPRLPRLPGRPDWMTDAACRGMPVAMFYPPKGAATRAAKRVCATCPVQTECLNYAVAIHDQRFDFGVWGGRSVRERRTLRRARPTQSTAVPVNVNAPFYPLVEFVDQLGHRQQRRVS
jgi:hypothetical protein